MKKMAIICGVFLSLHSSARADLIPYQNMGFENGNLDGWAVNVPMGLGTSGPVPIGYALVTDGVATEGNYALALGTAGGPLQEVHPSMFEHTATVRRLVSAANYITGDVRFFNGDFYSGDHFWVRIYEGGEVTTVWTAHSGADDVPGFASHHDGGIGYLEGTGWGSWSYTRKTPFWNNIILEFGADTRDDGQLASFAYHDNIRAYTEAPSAQSPIPGAPIPEPTTLGLMALGLAGLAVAARRKRRGL